MKTPQEIKEKKARIAEKLKVRVVGKTPEKVKKGPTGEFELFKKIALSRSVISKFHECRNCVVVKHIDTEGRETRKTIPLEDLTVTNFSHIIGKGRDKTKRLDPDNIEIVSKAYHFYQHTGQILQENFTN